MVRACLNYGAIAKTKTSNSKLILSLIWFLTPMSDRPNQPTISLIRRVRNSAV